MSAGELKLSALCAKIYNKTSEIYDEYKTRLAPYDFGYKVLYGPPISHTPVLFVGDQPGGNIRDEKPNERFSWPEKCEYATESWALATKMQKMFGSEFLSHCVGVNANFFRSPKAEVWRCVPKQVRDELEQFSVAQLLNLIDAIDPRLIVAIGTATLEKLTPTEPVLYGTKNRVLAKTGKIGVRQAYSVLHLSGAHISMQDRASIADFVKDLVG
jgi:hypothetical protein